MADLSLLFALMGQPSKSAAGCQTTTREEQVTRRQRDRVQAAQCIAKLLAVAPTVVQVLGAQLKLLATDEASLSLVSVLERMPPSWTSSGALSLATTCSREEEDQWLLEFVHAVVAWLRSKGKPPQSPAQPQGLIPTFLSALFPLAARYVEKTVLRAPPPVELWLPFTERDGEVFVLQKEEGLPFGALPLGPKVNIAERIVSVNLYGQRLPPFIQSYREQLLPLRPLGAFLWDFYEFGPAWQGRTPLLPAYHFFIAFKTESGVWYMLGKGQEGTDFAPSELDLGAQLPWAMLEAISVPSQGGEAPSPPVLLDRRVWQVDGEDRCDEDPSVRKVTQTVTTEPAVVQQVLDYVRAHPEPVGHQLFLGLPVARMVLGGPCTEEEQEDIRAKIQASMFHSCFAFVRELAEAIFRVDLDFDSYFSEDTKRQMSPPYHYG